MIFESHAHFDDEAFDEDRDELLSDIKSHGIETIVNVAASLSSVESTLKLSHSYPYVYAAIGVHPSETLELNDENLDLLRQRMKDERCVAVGEIGLDYHFLDEYPDPDKKTQKIWFEKQLQLARELDKPVIIHSRDAAADTLEIMKKSEYSSLKYDMHCYSYSKEMVKELNKLDCYYGIGGVITFKNAKKLIEALQEMPLNRIMLETDCPYLAPTPHRGERNSSYYLPLVAQRIAELKGLSYDDVVSITCENAKRFFNM
ncbi:MAG: TatD family hydrolase [Lachnospiraceae bacterium]|nr:TatD family hydrolase [Lachnospiraceae bacterium]